MDNSLSSLIESANSVLVLLPVNPSFDAAAAGLSLYLSINGKKPVTVASSSPMMVGMNRLIGVNKITTELGNKNLTIKFKNYDAANIEKVSYDIIDSEFNLTVVPKSGFVAPNQEQIQMGLSGVSADLVILVGGTNSNDFPALSTDDFKDVKLAHIGNRGLNSDREVMSLAKPGSSISEVVASLIKEEKVIDPDIATNLLMGIEEGSNNFTGSEVGPTTFEMFAFLLRSGGQRQPKTRLTPGQFPPGSIPTQPFNNVTPLGFPPLARQPSVMQPQPMQQMPQMPQMPPMPFETDAMDTQGTAETEQEINPPDDWLQPKVFKGAQQNPGQQPTTFSENKG